MITPKIGLRVWFWSSDLQEGSMVRAFDAEIVAVHDDHLVDLSVLGSGSLARIQARVLFLQEGEDPPTGVMSGFASPVPHQKIATFSRSHPDKAAAQGIKPGTITVTGTLWGTLIDDGVGGLVDSTGTLRGRIAYVRGVHLFFEDGDADEEGTPGVDLDLAPPNEKASLFSNKSIFVSADGRLWDRDGREKSLPDFANPSK